MVFGKWSRSVRQIRKFRWSSVEFSATLDPKSLHAIKPRIPVNMRPSFYSAFFDSLAIGVRQAAASNEWHTIFDGAKGRNTVREAPVSFKFGEVISSCCFHSARDHTGGVRQARHAGRLFADGSFHERKRSPMQLCDSWTLFQLN